MKAEKLIYIHENYPRVKQKINTYKLRIKDFKRSDLPDVPEDDDDMDDFEEAFEELPKSPVAGGSVDKSVDDSSWTFQLKFLILIW